MPQITKSSQKMSYRLITRQRKPTIHIEIFATGHGFQKKV